MSACLESSSTASSVYVTIEEDMITHTRAGHAWERHIVNELAISNKVAIIDFQIK